MRTDAPPARTAWPLSGSDLQGLARLLTDATVGVVDLVEAMHHTIASGAGIVGAPRHGPTRGITGLVYRSVRGTTRLVGQGAAAAFGALVPALTPAAPTPEREAALAVLNGVWGDHLADSGNPLAIRPTLRVAGQPLFSEAGTLLAERLGAPPRRRLLVLAHGLCMNDLQWQRQGHDHGQALARELGCSAVYLHFNSGRHVSQNGAEFSGLLDRLLQQWPLPVDELAILGHSMGGLVARSACHVAAAQQSPWLARLRRLVFLGTPHHGAPLERGGRLVDAALGLSPYVAPFARLGKARSAGITDLRYGNLQDADWQGRDRHTQRRDDRQPTPLPAGVACFLVAATLGEQPGNLRCTLLGDGLVPLDSALGRHRKHALRLAVPAERQFVLAGASHWDLLSHPEVYARLRDWLA